MFPKDTSKIVSNLYCNTENKDVLDKVQKMIDLIKTCIKSYNTTKLKQLVNIKEIRVLLKAFIQHIEENTDRKENIDN
jgi:hypothetical protein